MSSNYRIGIDLGTNSLGWCAVELDGEGRPCGVLAAGVRILTPNEEAGRDPQSKASLAAGRRDARSMRKRRDRFLMRQKALMRELIKVGLMPEGVAERKALDRRDPYFLRAAALDGRLDPYEIGRAIWHLNQRRGFKSNRVADGDTNEEGAMKAGMAALNEALEKADARTLGDYLARIHKRDRDGNRLDGMGRRIGKDNGGGHDPDAKGVRFRPKMEGAKVTYPLYPSRAMIEHELDAIWAAQKAHYPQLTEALLQRLKRVIVEQRPLKKPPVGKCTFRPEEERAPRALPLFQRFRILSEIAALEIERPGRPVRRLSMQERSALANLLSTSQSEVKFETLHKKLGLPDDAHFNLERGGRKGLQPDMTAAVLARESKDPKKATFGKGWRGFTTSRQTEIVEQLLTEEDEEALTDWLMAECGLSEAQARAAGKARLPQGHGHIGRSMLADLVDAMENESKETADPETGEVYPRPLTYDEAVERLGLHHSNFVPEKQKRLPYYGTAMARHVISNPNAPEGSQAYIGRVPNPTVHIALNQLRAVVNALIDTYGPPTEIAIELSRELKQSRKQKDEATRKNRENEVAKNKRLQEFAEMAKEQGVSPELYDTRASHLLLRLYNELPAAERVCVYCEKNIGSKTRDLFANAVDIDHILPRSKTLDDGFANKVICCLSCNRLKGNRPPADVWSGNALQEIVERAERLFPNKAWRFQPDAMSKFGDEAGFRENRLHDTKHMARLARGYLEHICDQVWASPGRLTSMLRGMWGLNHLMHDHNRLEEETPIKNRDDHRHHAIDAFVIACTDRGLLQRVATAAGRAEAHELDRWAQKGEFPEPFEGYRDALRDKLETLVVSHKPDHGLKPGAQGNVHVTSGKLHDATAYGRADDEIGGKRYNLVSRKPIHALRPSEIGRVRDIRLREELEALAYETKRDGADLARALEAYGERKNIRRVRILETRQDAYTRRIEHGDADRRFAKTYMVGDNHCLDVLEKPNGKWDGEAVTVFDANQPAFRPAWWSDDPRPRFVMRLHKGDLVEADFGDGTRVHRVVRLEPSARRVRLVSHRDAGNYEERHNDGTDPFRWNFASYQRLKEAGARRVRVDPIGRVSPVKESPAEESPAEEKR